MIRAIRRINAPNTITLLWICEFSPIIACKITHYQLILPIISTLTLILCLYAADLSMSALILMLLKNFTADIMPIFKLCTVMRDAIFERILEQHEPSGAVTFTTKFYLCSKRYVSKRSQQCTSSKRAADVPSRCIIRPVGRRMEPSQDTPC